MEILKLNCVSGLSAYSVLLGTVALPAFAADPALPWSFVNGAAEGYSIQLVSAVPSPGTAVSVGQTVEFKITVSYKLSIADKGAIVLVIQDENNRSLSPGNGQQSRHVARGEGTLAINASFVVPAGAAEVRLFIPLVPSGLEHTDGELVLRYPVGYEAKVSSIGYPSVAAALADLHSRADVKFSESNGWTIAEDKSHFTLWSFAPAGDPAFPSAVKRTAVKGDKGVSMNMNVLCESTQEACDRLVADFEALNRRLQDSFKNK
jgi:hypothetical protein